MAELAEVQPVKKAGFVSQRKTKNQERIEKDEQELKELLSKESTDAEQKEQEGEEVKTEASTDVSLSKEDESFKKRYGDIRRHMATKEKEWQSRIEALEAQLDKATKNELVLPKSDAEIGEWTKKYPDVAAIVETIADKKASEKAKELDDRVKQIEEMRYTATRDKAEAELMALHPDFAEIRESDEFHDWAEAQPKWSAATEINTRSKTTPVTDETKGQWRESQVDKMSDREYEKNAESIMESIRAGKFIYDISGAAR